MKYTQSFVSGMVLVLAVVGGIAPQSRASAQAAASHRAPVQADDTAPDGSTILPNGWHLSPAGQPIALPGDMPLKMVVTDGGKYLLVCTGGFHDNDVDVVDLTKHALVQSVDLAQVWAGMSVDDSGNVYIAGGGRSVPKVLKKAAQDGATPKDLTALRQPIYRLKFADGTLSQETSVGIPDLDEKTRWMAGLACAPGGVLYAINSEGNTLYRFAGGETMAVTASVTTQYHPYSVALSTDGKTLAVSNWGDQSVSLLDPVTLKEQARVPVGSHPNELVWAGDGRLFVANAGSNSVSVIRGGSVTETIKTSLRASDPVGCTPDALALSPDGKRLYVANADNNDVAVIDISDGDESGIMGFIPTGWYPSALAVSPDGKSLYVGTGKGLKFRANAPVASRDTPQPVGHAAKFDYIPSLLSGTVSVVPIPDAARLRQYTRQVVADTPKPQPVLTTSASEVDAQKAFKNIKHVVYIIRENRTYDQVFGDIPAGNGDPNLVFFGENVTPNGHALAGKYVLLDNLYCNGEVSEDGHQWCDADYVTDFTERAWIASYSGRGGFKADDRLTASPAGYLWDDCARQGVSYRAYGEASSFTSGPDQAPVFKGAKGLEGHASAAYAAIPWCAGARDMGRADVFVSDLRDGEKNNDWPQFMVLSLPDDHTQGLSAGKFTPDANVAMNDQALGKIVEAVSHSKFWDQTAIFVIEDDAQNGPDHVDAHRTEGLVISPYVKRNAVIDTMYTTSSFVRTMEMILGLPPMTQYDAFATPLYDCFTSRPAREAFDCLPPKTDLNATNPSAGAGETASAKLDWSAPDRADPDALNAILWHALKPGRPMPAPVRSARLAQ